MQKKTEKKKVRGVELAKLDNQLDGCLLAFAELSEKIQIVQVSNSKCWIFYNKRLAVSLAE